MNTRSISFRLVTWYAGLLTAVFLMLGMLTYMSLRHYLETNLRDTQASRADQIADTLLASIDATGEDFVAKEVKSLYAPETNERFMRITRDNGSVLYASGKPKDESFDPALVPPPDLKQKGEFVRNVQLPGENLLLIAGLRYQSRGGAVYFVEVGSSTNRIEAMLKQVLAALAIGLPIVLLIAVAGSWLLVQRALGPVDQIAHKAEQITQHNLSERLPVPPTGDELERLSISLNHMIARLEDALQNSKRFLADASHELRTPLTILRGELENIVQAPCLPEDYHETLVSMLEEVERLAKIVEGLLVLSRLDAGEALVQPVRFDFADLAVTTADQVNLLAQDKSIAIFCSAPHPVSVEGDRARLKQVIVNLLDNAIKYTSTGGTIRLKVSRQNGHAILDVVDNGIGIPEPAIPHVFDRFYRVDNARTREQGGAGLGLSIVKSICTAHGAEVRVESLPEQGSHFQIKLPALPAENFQTEN